MSNYIDNDTVFTNGSIEGIQRTRFNMPHGVKQTFSCGDLVPFDLIEICPGDSIDLKTNMVLRLQSLITPVMDTLYADVYYFFVPHRIVWDDYKKFIGETNESAFEPLTNIRVPYITSETGCDYGSLLDYLGVPPKIKLNADCNAPHQLAVRGYVDIWNNWFRDENLQNPIFLNKGNETVVYNKDLTATGGKLLKANKYHDYFTSCLPSPTRNAPVKLPLGRYAPVGSYGDYIEYPGGIGEYPNLPNELKQTLHMSGVNSNIESTVALGVNKTNHSTPNGASGLDHTVDSYNSTALGSHNQGMYPTNLVADLTGSTAATINDLRLAIATQHYFEKSALGGNRYREWLHVMWNVDIDDRTIQIPELVSYNQIPVTVHQVVQQSESNNTPLGNVAAMSLTVDTDDSVHKSFTEAGYLFGLVTVRYKNTYQQGISRTLTRKTLFDFYNPVFANISNQPVYRKEIYSTGNVTNDNAVFGYQEAWADYRYIPDRTAGEMRSSHPLSLDVWHLGDDYEEAPILSPQWIEVDENNVNRVLAVSDSVADQLLLDCYVDCQITRNLPMYSVPGIDKI